MAGVNGFGASSTPDMENRISRYLELMITSWTNRGLSIGFKTAEDPLSVDLSEDSGIKIDDLLGVASNLAVFAMQTMGQSVSPPLLKTASDSYNALFSAEIPQVVSNCTLPAGGGLGGEYQPYIDPLTVENNGNLDDLTT
ncbi:MAG: hypothetical protein CMC15_18805 [Flavobacteriaceae bacterium]|nr:hypothetical protein [Flavobacteriaceae bacterium]